MYDTLNNFTKKIFPSWLYLRLIGNWDKDGFKRYFVNTGWMFFARIGNMSISLLATLYIARQLGPTNYGELSYAISFVALFSFIAYFGIDSVLYRELIKYPDRKNEFMGSALIIRMAAAIVSIILTVISAYILSPDDVSFYLIILISLGFIFQSFNIIGYEFQAEVQSKYFSILTVVITVILNILKITVIYLGEGVLYLAMILLLEAILYASGGIYLRYKTYGSLFNWKFDVNVAKIIIFDSWPFIFTSTFTVIYSRVDQIMLKNIIDASSVGIYDAAVRLSEIWYFIPAIIVSSLFPAIVNAKSYSKEEYKDRVKKLFLFIISITIIIAILTSIFAQNIVNFVFGADFSASGTVLKIYIWALIPTSIIIISNYILLAENAKKIIFTSALLGMITNVYFNSILIPLHQTIGAAISTLISGTLIALFLITYLRTKRLM